MNLAEVATKYGALGVVCFWLGVTNLRLSNVESKLEDCQEAMIDEIRNKVSNIILEPNKTMAILPQQIKIEDENS